MKTQFGKQVNVWIPFLTHILLLSRYDTASKIQPNAADPQNKKELNYSTASHRAQWIPPLLKKSTMSSCCHPGVWI